MGRHVRSSATHSLPLTYYVPENTALRIVSKHLVYLTNKRQLIDQMIETKGKYVNLAARELIRSRSCVENQIKVLTKLRKKFNSESTKHRALSFVAKLLWELEQKSGLICEAEERLSLGKSLFTSQKCLIFKSEITHQIDVIQRIYREISLAQFPLSSAELGREVAEYECPPLLHLREFKGFTEIYKIGRLEYEVSSNMMPLQAPESPDESLAESTVTLQLKRSLFSLVRLGFTSRRYSAKRLVDSLGGSLKESSAECAVESAGNGARESSVSRHRAIRNLKFSPEVRRGIPEIFPPWKSVEVCKEVQNPKFSGIWKSVRLHQEVRHLTCRGSMKANETRSRLRNKHRYLYVNTGFEIFCLDLKQRKDQTFSNAQDVPFFPRIATLDLVEDNLPTLAGMFKWRSKAYLIGGYKTSEASMDPTTLDKKIKPTSCVTYCLSLLADNCTISHSESNIGQLEKPKLWSIVEEINGQIHVIDSTPPTLPYNCRGWSLTHEVFDRDFGCRAEEIPTPSEEYIEFYSVLGDRLYAAGGGTNLVFDSNTRKWEAYPRRVSDKRREDLQFFNEVWRILSLGPGKCVGTFPYGEARDPLYVVISLQPPNGSHLDGMYGLACLVTATGQIVCIQRLHDFFKGPVWPARMSKATIIQVDDEFGKGKTTMCSIVCGDAWDEISSQDFLFINIFGVEMLSEAVPMAGELLEKGSEAWPVEKEFVRVDTKESYIYRTDEELGWGIHPVFWPGLQACFF